MKSFLLMLSFFTRIPVRARMDTDAAHFEKGIKYLFIIAMMIGVVTAGVFLLGQYIGPYFASLVSWGAYLMITGGLHIDGMADTMDAVGSRRDRTRMLEIMKDSRIGTFGVLAICVYAAGMIIFAARLPYIVIGLYPLVGRTAALMAARTHESARPDGLGFSFIGGVRTHHIIVAAAAYVLIAAACFYWAVLSAEQAALLAAAYTLAVGVTFVIIHRIAKSLCGITGDVIGLGIETAQWIYLACACIAFGII